MSMTIRKLEMQGFKSFPDRTKVVFHGGITAIIGPNGTGKSNLLDAVLWAIGGMRLKSLRGDRVDDIIFNGNAKRPALNMADVVLYLGSDGEELTISHRVFRSGESEYRLNGKSARLKDIQDELRKHQIGEKEYFVIEQGAIGNFVTSKPNEKRGLIEEAAGTAFYKDKRRQAQIKLENTEQNLIRLEDIIAEVEKQKNSLQRQAQAANRYRRLRERIRELSAHHYRRKLAEIECNKSEALMSHQEALKRENELTFRIKESEKEITARRAELGNLEKQIELAQEKVFSFKSLATKLESEIERKLRRIQDFEDRKKQTEKTRDEFLAELLLLTEEKESCRQSIFALETELNASNQELEAAARDAASAGKGREQIEQAIKTYREEFLSELQLLTESKNEKARLEKELELLTKQEQKSASQLEEQSRQLDEISRNILKLEQILLEEVGVKNKLNLEYQQVSGLRTSVEQKLAGLQTKLEDLRKKHDEAEFHLQALKKIEELERQEIKAENIEGDMGILADLVSASPENAPLFDLYWQEESRSRVVPANAFLANAGEKVSGRFLLIPDKERAKIPQEILSRPDVLGLLIARVEASEKIKEKLPLLEDAVVVSSLKDAISCWLEYPDQNFVTISGDVLLSSGLLKTGQKARGMMTLASEIKAIEDRLASLKAEVNPLQVEVERLFAEKDSLDKTLADLTLRTGELEISLQARKREIEYNRREAEKTKTAAAVISKELEIFQEEKTRIESSLAAVRARVQSTEKNTASLQLEIQARESELAEVSSRAGESERDWLGKKSAFHLLREKISNLQNIISNLQKREAALKNRLNQFETETITCDQEKNILEAEIVSSQEKLKSLNENNQALEAALSTDELRREELKQTIDKEEANIKMLREEEHAARNARMQHEIRRAEIDRDLVNLEEMCWQELKKTLAELRRESSEIEEPGQKVETDLEEPEELADEEEAAETAEPQTEIIRSKRGLRKMKPVEEMTDEEVDIELEAARDSLNRFKAVNLMAEEEFLELKKRYDFLVSQRQDLRESIKAADEAIRKIDQESEVQFLKAVAEVNNNFNEIFKTLFRGGHAEVKLLEPDNPLETGVEIVAQPPGKRLQNLSLLSGGEKSLTSLAFLFALFRYRPSPFCILDEVDAGLDDINLQRFLELMKKIKHQTQFIIITHNFKTMEVADYIYGTTMPEPSITRLLSVKLEQKTAEIDEVLKPAGQMPDDMR